MAIISYVVFVSILITKHSFYGVSGSKFCFDRMGKSICCFNYEKFNGGCIECKRGSTSWDGGPCLPCKDNTYGFKCLKTCSCKYYQRCDPDVGCVTSMTKSESSTLIAGSAQTDTNSMHITVVTMTHNGDENKSLSDGWILSFSLFAITLLVCVHHQVRKYMRKSKLQNDRKKRVAEGRHTGKNISLPHHEYIEVDNVYEEIDENMMDENLFPLKQNKSDTVESKRSSDSSYFDIGSYLDPCHVLDEESVDGKSSCDSKDFSYFDRHGSAYLNPYLALEQPSETNVHVYEPKSIVHKTTDIFSEFESINNLNSYDISAGSKKSNNGIIVFTPATNEGNTYMTMQIRHSLENIHVLKPLLSLKFSDTLFNKCNSVPLTLDKSKNKNNFTQYREKAFHLSYENFFSTEAV